MKEEDLFVVEIEKLNRRITVERALDEFLNVCLKNEAKIESHHLVIKELMERYMSVIRSRNKVRRNWHPDKARSCDIFTLQWISKDRFQSSLEKRLRKALMVSINGKKVIPEELIQQIVNETTSELYESNRKNLRPSSLEDIVRTIHSWNPDVTHTDVINTMKSTPKDFGIIEIDDTSVVIRVAQGRGKQYLDKPRALSTIKNILTRIKTPKRRGF
jgi:hypothetical protein